MPDSSKEQRFFASTRGKIVLLLRNAPSTVDQLAIALELTDNAVRAHLAGLERDGLIRTAGTVRSTRRPSLRYELAPDADRLFPKAYGEVLNAMLSVLQRKLPPDVIDHTLREAGRELGVQRLTPRGRSAASRIESAVAVLEDMGGSVLVERSGREVHLHGRSCPLSAVVRQNPEVCALAEALLQEVTGLKVDEHCERSEPPHCHFVLGSSAVR